MAKKTAQFSLSSFKMGDIAVDGGMSTDLTEIGLSAVVRNTVSLTQEEGTETTFDLEIEDTPFYQTTQPGATTLVGDLYVTDAQQLESLFGGTYIAAVTGGSPAPASWEAPTNTLEKEVSVELTNKSGNKLQVPRLKMTARLEFTFQREALAVIHLSGTVLTPTKTGVGPLKFIEALS